jgi:hypothetical protein
MGVHTITTTNTQAATYSLTTLAAVKLELAITDTTQDTWLGNIIQQISAQVASHCNRVFPPETITDTLYIEQDPYPYQTPGGVEPLQLSRWPVLSIASVTQIVGTENVNGTITNTTQALVAGQDYELDALKGELLRLNPFTGVATCWEALPTIVEYTAGYGTETEESYTVSGGTPSYTVQNAAAFSIDQGVTYASTGAALKSVAANPTTGQYSVNNQTGVYTFAAGDDGAVLDISYAYSVIPFDLTDAVLQLITARYWSRGRDPSVMQTDGSGPQGSIRYWVSDPQKANGAFPPSIAGLLDGIYRVPVVA